MSLSQFKSKTGVILGYLNTTKSMEDDTFVLTGTTPNLDPDQGALQTWTLTGNSTPVDTLTNGQSMTLMIDDGAAYSVTWPTITWDVASAVAPVLKTTGYTTVMIWKVGTTLYGRY